MSLFWEAALEYACGMMLFDQVGSVLKTLDYNKNHSTSRVTYNDIYSEILMKSFWPV